MPFLFYRESYIIASYPIDSHSLFLAHYEAEDTKKPVTPIRKSNPNFAVVFCSRSLYTVVVSPIYACEFAEARTHKGNDVIQAWLGETPLPRTTVAVRVSRNPSCTGDNGSAVQEYLFTSVVTFMFASQPAYQWA